MIEDDPRLQNAMNPLIPAEGNAVQILSVGQTELNAFLSCIRVQEQQNDRGRSTYVPGDHLERHLLGSRQDASVGNWPQQ